ncbi:MAG: hypothetical protein ACJASX_004025 [Limisphaerales bacterium]|jgi:hypothetical protein
MAALAFISTVLFILYSGLLDERKMGYYWLVKFGYVTTGMAMGIVLTALWEEQVVAGVGSPGGAKVS